ncbi:heparinase II/III family protein [Caulobacter sp. HMWF025]|uniref:heparinase II/III family protein n=3 Tax=unclassified Caulobacter TaxID=2648921 RepID=UPI000D3ACC12|nr:heparinase II/III family protein [Caulobacter sp. HMWF025]PTT09279.1 heparinase [Caulobacter sp. HMWF025]
MDLERFARGLPGLPALPRGGVLLQAIGAEVRSHVEREWFGAPPHRLALSWPRPRGLAAHPHDPRPADAERGRRIIAGVLALEDAALRLGEAGDPFNMPSPSRRFAVALHRFAWLPELVAAGPPGTRRALRLIADWRRIFSRWNGFSWSGECLERRVFHLACAARALASDASDAEIADLALDLARGARQLLKASDAPDRTFERAVIVAIAGCVLEGPVGDRLITAGLKRVERDMEAIVRPDGGHANRSPEAGVELLFDLLTLDDALGQRGRPSPEGVTRAIDRLSSATRFFTLADGHLAAFHGGEALPPARIAAALAHDDAGPRPPDTARHSGFQRMQGGSLQVMADTGPPPTGPLSRAACAQPAAVEIVCGKDRLITSCGWSPEAPGAQAFRLSDAASTVSVGDGSAGRPLSGFRARALGPWLVDGATQVEAKRHDAEGGVWLDITHDGWKRLGLTHARRLFLDAAADELRGEDSLVPLVQGDAAGPRRYLPFAVRFHLHPDANASLARDRKSVLIRGPSNVGWWLRNDAADVEIAASAHFDHGHARKAGQIVLKSQVRPEVGAKIRWKLVRAEGH